MALRLSEDWMWEPFGQYQMQKRSLWTTAFTKQLAIAPCIQAIFGRSEIASTKKYRARFEIENWKLLWKHQWTCAFHDFFLNENQLFFKLFESSMVTLIFFLNGSSTSILTLFEEVNFMKGKPSKETHEKNSTNQKRKLCFPFLMTAKKNRYFFRFSKLLRSKAHNGIVEAILIFAFCESWKSRRSSLFSSDANKESLDWLMVRRN